MPALEQFLGSAAGLSPATVTRLTAQWRADHRAFQERDLSGTDYVYVWGDGTKELVAMADGHRESSEAWAGLLRDCAHRGMRAPVLAVGDGALGFWKALREVFPATREQRCWVREIVNVLDALAKSAQPAAKKALRRPTTPRTASTPSRPSLPSPGSPGRSSRRPSRRSPRPEELLAFYDVPDEHWIHLRTTNSIESTFATVRLRTKVTKGAGSRAAALAMVFELVEFAQHRWRAVNAPRLVALVCAGACFERGILVARPNQEAA
ncbi:transposase [Streptomyces sp. NPDC006314]|uniref:transposase n=1 Tax=Streptomyces sp. NPDC006314 TaxID=3154475 RepID=UPI0033BEAE35